MAGAFGGHAAHVVANALAASAAARALGVPVDVLARALRSFDPHTRNPGRGCVYQVGDNPVLVDYAHNPAAVAAMGAFVERRWGPGASPRSRCRATGPTNWWTRRRGRSPGRSAASSSTRTRTCAAAARAR